MSEKDKKSGESSTPPLNPQLVSLAKPPAQPPVLLQQQFNLTHIQPGAFLPAAEIQALAAIDPSFPERIMKLTEATIAHNHTMQREQLAQSKMVVEFQAKANEINATAHRLNMRRTLRTDWMGFVLMGAVLASAVWDLWKFHDQMLLKIFLGGMAAIAGLVWVQRRRTSSDDHHQPASK